MSSLGRDIVRAATGGDGSTVTTANGKTFFYNNVFGGYLMRRGTLQANLGEHSDRLFRIPTVSVRIGQVTLLDSDAQRDAAGEIGEYSDCEFFFFATSLRGVTRFGFAFISGVDHYTITPLTLTITTLANRTHGCDVGHCIVSNAAVQMSALFIPPYSGSYPRGNTVAGACIYCCTIVCASTTGLDSYRKEDKGLESPRNLDNCEVEGMCAYDYKKRNPDAGKADFETYFTGMPSNKRKFWREEERRQRPPRQQLLIPRTRKQRPHLDDGASSAGVGWRS
ncbi:hypothetical protein B0H14DRAFT_2567304 [Mycena olivaceomarginata]|nr:hypothetical protein B0H14DRAFT_2567304 [Mycena olivaceomarginata]